VDVALVIAIGKGILFILNFVQILVLISIVLSWVSPDPNNQIVQVLYNMTEPLFRPLRRLTANFPGPIDWAPMLLLLIIYVLGEFIKEAIQRYAASPAF
jgi:YggT family protein